MPAYNEGERLPQFLRAWAEQGASRREPVVTALVVDDGSAPGHESAYVQAIAEANEVLARAGAPHRIEYHRVPTNRGKGAAIRRGWSFADPAAEWLSFVDADGAVDPREFWRLAEQLPAAACDALCGARVATAGRSLRRSMFRRLQGRFFAAAVEQVFHLGLHDTQCGIKFFRAGRVRAFLERLREDRWLLDVEVLAWLKIMNARVVEVPIDCHERGGSAVVLGVDPLRMLAGLVALRARLPRRPGAGP
jgi:dolichyl-phosphate beta-glucosyltransferase